MAIPVIDLIGRRSGKLLVIARAEASTSTKRKPPRWLCRCDCGKEVIVVGDRIRAGDALSCGCSRANDLTGKRYGKLVALMRKENIGTRTRWECQCDCGNKTTVDSGNLTAGNQESCGCIKANKYATHPLWHIYCGIIIRCENKDFHAYHRYGGKGIKICEEWRNSFERFVAYMGDRPSLDHSVDRWPNPLGNYEPGNCRWATDKEQSRNKSDNVMITHNGKTQCMSAWAEEVGIAHGLLWIRLKSGWTIEQALSPTKWRRRENINAG